MRLDRLFLEKKNVDYEFSCLMYKFPTDISKKIVKWGERTY